MGYPGGKSGAGTYHKLIRLMPPHQLYAAPFLGDDAVMKFKRPAALNIGVDLNEDVIAVWRSRVGENAACRSLTGSSAAAVLRGANTVLAGGNGKSASSRRLNLGAAVNPPVGSARARTVEPPSRGNRRFRRVDPRTAVPPLEAYNGASAAVLSRFRFLRGDGLTFLKSYPLGPDDLVYLDPPYLLETRTSGRQYRHEFSREQHIELLSTIGELPCMVMISGYWSQLYADALKGWNAVHFEVVIHRAIHRTEWVWFNFPEPTELHDPRYAAANTRKTQDLKRKIASCTGKLARMSPLERQAVVEAVLAIAGHGKNAAPIS